MYHLITVAIGDEIVSGQSMNTNAGWLAEKWIGFGGLVEQHFMIRDDVQSFFKIIDSITACSEHKYCVLCIGGLGPTSDDKTRDMAALYFKKDMLVAQSWVEYLISNYPGIDRGLLERQSFCFDPADVIPNPYGTALPFIFYQKEHIFLFLPGVPKECLGAAEIFFSKYRHILFEGDKRVYTESVCFFHLSERALDHELSSLKERCAFNNLGWGLYPQEGFVRVSVKSYDKNVLYQATAMLKAKYKKFVLEHHDHDYGALHIQKKCRFFIDEKITCGLISSQLSLTYPFLRKVCDFHLSLDPFVMPTGETFVCLQKDENDSHDLLEFYQNESLVSRIRLLKKKSLSFRQNKIFYCFLGFVENILFRQDFLWIDETEICSV